MNYEQMIADSLRNGESLEDLARNFTAALNKKQKEIELAKKEEMARDNRYDGLIDNINAAIDVAAIDLKTAASAATAYVIDEHDDWDLQTIDQFYTEALQSLQALEEIYVKRLEGDPVIKALDKFCSMFDRPTPAPIGAPLKGCTCETKKNEPGDKEKIKQFLKDMGW